MQVPEHIGTIIDRGMNLRGCGSRTLVGLAEEFWRYERDDLPDAVVPLNSLRMASSSEVEVPDRGTFSLNPWSQRQVSALLGLRWDRWFASADERTVRDEMDRRFRRAPGEMRLRLRRTSEGPGELKAFVSPAYTAVRDSDLVTALVEALRAADDEMRVVRSAMTCMTTSFVIAVGRPYRVGGPGEVGDVWGGLSVRNSGVGYAALTCTLHLTRLVCRNGMTLPCGDGVLFRRAHRRLRPEQISDALAPHMAHLQSRLRRGGEVLARAATEAVRDPDDELRRVLQTHHLPMRLLPAVLDAYRREPLPSRFGISQALTLAAQGVSSEDRHDLEQAAGRYLQ